MPRKSNFELRFPIGGLNRRFALQDQRPFTTADAVNVRPDGTIEGRDRGGRRPGLIRTFSPGIQDGVRLLESITLPPKDPKRTIFDEFFGGISPFWVFNPAARVGSHDWEFYTGGLVGSPPGIQPGLLPENTAYREMEVPGVDTDEPFTLRVFVPSHNWLSQINHRNFMVRLVIRDDQAQISNVFSFQGLDDFSLVNFEQLRPGVVTEPERIGVTVEQNPPAGWVELTFEPHGRPQDHFQQVTIKWNETILAQHTVLRLNVTHVGVGMNATAGDGHSVIDAFEMLFTGIVPSLTETSTILVAGGGSNIAFQNDTSLESFAVKPKHLDIDRHTIAASQAQRLFIAYHGPDVESFDVTLRVEDVPGVPIGTAVIDHSLLPGRTISELGIKPGDKFEVIDPAPGQEPQTVTVLEFRPPPFTQEIAFLDAPIGTAEGQLVGGRWKFPRRPLFVDFDAGAVVEWFADPGKGEVPQKCKLISRFQDRIILAAPEGNEHQWFASRQGDAFDWDFFAGTFSDLDPGIAVAGQNSAAGTIGRPMTALAPFIDDYHIFAAQDGLWVLRGNPAAGGVLDNISLVLGIVDARAWTFGPSSEFIFLSNDGLFALAPNAGSSPVSLSRESLPRELINLSSSETTVLLEYDVVFRGVHIYVTPEQGPSSQHWWFDWETKSFWPVKFGSSGLDPLTVVYHEADLPSRRGVVLGCRDGLFRRYHDTAANDDSTSFDSHVLYGPVRLGGNELGEGLLTEMVGTLADGSGPVSWSVLAGDSPEEALGSEAVASGQWEAGRNLTDRPRARGQSFYLKLQGVADSRWALEGIVASRQTAGRQKLL